MGSDESHVPKLKKGSHILGSQLQPGGSSSGGQLLFSHSIVSDSANPMTIRQASPSLFTSRMK